MLASSSGSHSLETTTGGVRETMLWKPASITEFLCDCELMVASPLSLRPLLDQMNIIIIAFQSRYRFQIHSLKYDDVFGKELGLWI